MKVTYSSNKHHRTKSDGTGLAGASVVPNSKVYSAAFCYYSWLCDTAKLQS